MNLENVIFTKYRARTILVCITRKVINEKEDEQIIQFVYKCKVVCMKLKFPTLYVHIY